MAKKRKKATKARKKAVRRKTKTKRAKSRRKSGLTQMTYTVSDELEAIVHSKKLTRPLIVKKLWVYIKAHKLQDSRNRRMINPDKKLSEVIGSRPVDMMKLAGLLSKHIKK